LIHVPVICRDFDVLYNDVPGTGGPLTARVLTDVLRGQRLEPTHLSFRRTPIVDPPSIRVITVREPVDWYRWYWARARASVVHPGAWPLPLGHKAHEPTRPLDERCGHGDFQQFVRNVIREFPDGFLRSVYCDFLNGATHVLRYDTLADDLTTLLRMRGGLASGSIASRGSARGVPTNKWWRRAVVSERLERELREAENLDGLDVPYISRPAPVRGRVGWARRRRAAATGTRPAGDAPAFETQHGDPL
jgi:hypothetical protein